MRNYILSNFPFLEDDFDALTDYELFCKMLNYMKKASIKIDEFEVKLNKYENYFNDLDVQEEINNKLQEMYENGELASLVADFLALKSTYTFDTVSDLKSSTNLVDGCTAKTLGYYSINDGGDAYYYIRDLEVSDTPDDMFLIAIGDDLVAELIIKNNEVNAKQVGLTGDSSDDATDGLLALFGSGYNLYFPAGTYNTDSQLPLTNHSIRGDNPNVSIIKYSDDTNNRQLIETSDLTMVYISNLCFDCGEATDETKTAINLYDCTDIKIKNCEFKNGYGSQLRLNGSTYVLIEDTDFNNVSGATGNMGNAIYCHPVTNLTIKNCTCQNIREDFLYLDGDDTHIVKNVIIDGCYLHDTSYNNNDTVSHCIGINGYCDNVTVSNSIFIDNGNGIRCQGRYGFTPTNIFMYGNRISDNDQNGINITADGCVVSDNIIYSNGQDGIYILDSDNISCNNNIIHNNTRYGLYGRNSNYISCNSNRIYDNTSAGIVMGDASTHPVEHTTISNCDVYKTSTGTQATGIQIVYGDDIKVLSCHAYNNTVDYDINRATTTNFISQLNPSYAKTGVCSLMYSNAIPTGGSYTKGDIVLYTSPSAGGKIGAVCVTAGSPGTWKEFGTIES